VGRDPLAARIAGRIASHSARVTGERRLGKTSLLHHLQRVLSEPSPAGPACSPVFVDLETATPQGPFHTLVADILEALRPPPRLLDRLHFAPASERYEASEFRHDVAAVLEWRRGCEGRAIRLVLLVDEIDGFGRGTAGREAHWLEQLLETCSAELRVVLAGTRAAEPCLAGKALDEWVLQPLTPEQAEDLVTRPVAGRFGFERSAIDRILQLSRLRPYPIQGLCFHALNRVLDDGRTTVSLADVDAVAGREGRPFIEGA
jgi:hypothetical protein